MSEIRKVAIKMKGEETILAACKNAGMEAIKDKDRIMVRNSGIRTFGGKDLLLLKQADGTYILEGDTSQKELEELSNKLKAFYGEIIAVRTAASKGYNLTSRKVEGSKIKVQVRTFA